VVALGFIFVLRFSKSQFAPQWRLPVDVRRFFPGHTAPIRAVVKGDDAHDVVLDLGSAWEWNAPILSEDRFRISCSVEQRSTLRHTLPGLMRGL